MIEIQGQYNRAKVFTDRLEPQAYAQILNLLNQPFCAGSVVAIMPDVHAGVGCTIGTTMTITDKVVPNLVGVDIGCGMETLLLDDKHIELQQLDRAIHERVPAGFAVRGKRHGYADDIDLSALRCARHVDTARAALSVGTLGGGNHFIELARDDDGALYLVIHTGSRHLGRQVAEYYQKAAARALERQRKDGSALVQQLKQQGREHEIEQALKALNRVKIDRVLAYVEGALLDDYLHDMALVQRYAALNRAAIARELVKALKLKVADNFATVHNYIDLDRRVLRKGAISAQAGERVLIPMNMRDGSLLCVGKGNADWNNSAPHGAGRLMSRSAAKQSITLSQYKASMQGIYSTTVNQSTLDESPFAYKPMDEVIAHMSPAVDIVKVIKPLYNFKAGDQ